jgi:hypothetical protein
MGRAGSGRQRYGGAEEAGVRRLRAVPAQVSGNQSCEKGVEIMNERLTEIARAGFALRELISK